MHTDIREKIIDLKIRSREKTIKAVREKQETINEFINRVASYLDNGTDVILLSSREMNDNEFLDCANKLKQLCEIFETTLIIESRADIAYLSGADCVNLKPEDIDIQSARKIFGEEILIGISLNTLSDGLNSVKDGADYISVERIPSTPTEPVKKTGLEYAKWVSENTLLPVLYFED